MPGTAVDAAIAEINDALQVMGPQREGLGDYAALNLQPDTLLEVQASIAQYDRRLGFMKSAKAALEHLRDDGYPALDVREIASAAFQDLQDNAATIQAALAKFASNTAVTMRVTAGSAERKA